MQGTFRFNRTNLDKLPHADPGKRDNYADEALPGLMVRVTEKGAKSFYVRRRVGARAVRVTLGRYPDMTPEQARIAARNALSSLLAKENPNEEKRERAQEQIAQAKRVPLERQSVKQVLTDYVRYTKVRDSTETSYRGALSNVLGAAYERPLLDITAGDVMLMHNRYDSQAQANKAMRALRALFNFHLDRCDLLDRANPVARALTKPGKANRWHTSKRRKTYIEPDALPDWFDAVESLPAAGYRSTWNGETARDLFLFQLLTGLRSRDECASLQWSQVDMKRGLVTYQRTKTTEHDDIVIPLNSHALEVLKRRSKGDFVFPSKKGGFLSDSRQYVDKVRNATRSEWTPYDARRTFITTGERLEIPMLTIKRLVNHASAEYDVTAGYIGRDLEAMRLASQRIGDAIMRDAKRLDADNVVRLAKAE